MEPESTLVTEQETEGKEVHSDASGLQVDKFPRQEKKHGESLPENSLMDDKEEYATAVTKIDPEILHTGVDVLDETKTKTSEFFEMVGMEGDSISLDHAVSKKHDDSEDGKSGSSEEQSTVEPEENHTESSPIQKSPEIIKPTDYSHVSLPLEHASLGEETPIQEWMIVKHVESDLNDAVCNAPDTKVETTIHEDREAPKEEISQVQRTNDRNNIPEQVEEDKPNQDLTSSIKQEAEIGNLPPEDISPSNLTVEEHHGNAEESAKPASTKGDGSLQEFQSDAQTDEAASEDVRELLEVPVPAVSEETKEDLAYITNVVPQVSEENSTDQEVIEKENETIDRDALLSTDALPLGASDISPHEEPQKAIKNEDIDCEKSIPGLASNDQMTKQEQGNEESIIETADKCASGETKSVAEIELQDHGKDVHVGQSLEDSSEEVTSLDPECRSTEAVFPQVSSAEALVDFPEELPNQETTQTSSEGKSEGTDTEGNIVCEATDASFATSLKEELLQNEGYEPAESNIRDSPRKDIASECHGKESESREYQADDPLEGKSEKIEEPSIEKKTEDAKISGGEDLADEQNQQATEDIPTCQDLSEESEIYMEKHAAEEREIEDAEDSSCDIPELELSLETCQKDKPKQEAGPNADVLQTSNQSKEPETTEDTQRLNTEAEIQDRDVKMPALASFAEEAVKCNSVEERYIPDYALVSHEDSEFKVDDTSDEMDNVSQNTKLEDTEQVEPNQDLTSSTDETYMDSGTVDNQNSKEEFINPEAEKGKLPLEEVNWDISPSNLTVEEHHGNIEESAKPASTEKDGSLEEFQSDAQTDEAAEKEDCCIVTSDEIQKPVVSATVKDARELLEVPIPTVSEETKESKKDLAYITNVVPQVSEVNSCDEKVIEKENETIDRDTLLSTDVMSLGASDIFPHEEPQKAIKSEDIEYEESIPGLATNDETTKQEQGDKESIIETTEKYESEAEIELQDHGKDTDSAVQTVEHHNVDQPLEDSSKEVTNLDPECRSTEAAFETNVAKVSSAEGLVDFPEEMPPVKLPNQEETTQTSSEGKSDSTDKEGNIVCEATDASFATSLQEELLQNEGYEPAESNIAGESKADDDPLEGKREKTEEPSIEKKTEDEEITGGEHLADEQNQQATEPLSIEDQNYKSQEDIPTSQDLSEESEIHITAKENDQIEDKSSAEDSSSNFPEQELSLETYQKDEPKQEAGPNADVLQTSNQSKEPETAEDSQRLNTEAVKCNAVEERYIPDDALVSHMDSELKVDDTSDEMDNMRQNTKLEDTEKTIDCIPAEEGKVDDHEKNSTKEGDLKSEEYPGAIQNEMRETVNSESKIVQMTDSQEMTDENKFIITEEPHTVSTSEEIEEKNTNDRVARDELNVKADLEVRENEKPELLPINASQIKKVVFEETMNYNDAVEGNELNPELRVSKAEIDSNEDTKHVETGVTEATQSLKNQVDEPNPGLTAEETIVQSPAEEIKEMTTDDKGIINESPQQLSTSEETVHYGLPREEKRNIHATTVTESRIDEAPGTTHSASESAEVEELPTIDVQKQGEEKSEDGNVDATGIPAEEKPDVTVGEISETDPIINLNERTQIASEDQIDEESFQVVTAEKTINHTSAEVQVEVHASNSTKEDDLRPEAFTGETKEETIEEPRRILTSEEKEEYSPAKKEDINIIDTTVIDELNQKVLEPETTYDTESFRRQMQGGENVVEELSQLSNTEEIVYQAVERKQEWTVNDATVLDDECHQEGMVNEISSADNNSTENIKLEESITTEAACIQTDEVPFQDSSSNKISDKECNEGAFDELTIDENSNVHQINDTSEIPSMESEPTKPICQLEEHKLIDVTQSVGEKYMPAEDSSLESPCKSPIVEEVIVDKEDSIAKVDEMNSESKSEDTRSMVDEMPENIINTSENTMFDETEMKNPTQPSDDNVGEGKNPVSVVQEEEPVQNEEATFSEGESRGVTNQIDSSSTKIEEKDDLAVLQDPAAVHTPFKSSTPVSDEEKEEEMPIIHPKGGDESLQPEVEEVEPEGEVITEEVSIIMQDSSSKEHKIEENFQEQGNMSTQTKVTKLNEEEKYRDENECQPALTTGHDSAREAQSEPIEQNDEIIANAKDEEQILKSRVTSEETIEEPRQISNSEETGDYSPAKEEGINIDDTTVIDELNEKVLEPETVDDTESSTRQMRGEELPQLSNTEEIMYHAVERKEESTVNDATILDNEFHQEGMVDEISSANNNLIENIKLEEGIKTEIAHEERTIEVPSQDSSSNKISSQDLSDKEHNEGALHDTAIDELKVEGNLDFHHIDDTAEIPSMESEATKLEEHRLNDATQSVSEIDMPAEDSSLESPCKCPIVEEVIVDKEESIAKVDEINSESKSEDTTIEVQREPNLITTEGLSPASEDREATNNVYDSNMEIEERGVPDPQTDAIISRDIQVPSESPVAESSSEIIEEMEHEDALRAVSNTVNTISKECTLNDDNKDEKVEEPIELSSPTSVINLHEHENDSTTEIKNEPYFLHKIPTETTNQIDSSSTAIEEKDGLAVLQDLAAVHKPFESSTPVSDVDNLNKEDPKTGTDAGQEEVTIFHPDGDESLQPEVEKKEPGCEVITKEVSIIMQDSGSKEQESEAFKISDADQDMEITATEDPKTGIDTKIASEDKIMSTSNVVAHAVSSSAREISFKDDEMGANAKEQVRCSDQESVNEDKEEHVQKNSSASKVENEQSLNNRQADEMLTEGKVPEIQHGEAKESMTSLEDLLQTSRNGSIKAAEDPKIENEPTIPGNDSPVLVEASRDADVKITPKKSNNILSGVGSKVKNSIAKVKKVITGNSSSPKPSSLT